MMRNNPYNSNMNLSQPICIRISKSIQELKKKSKRHQVKTLNKVNQAI
jgi:hypothetical protein